MARTRNLAKGMESINKECEEFTAQQKKSICVLVNLVLSGLGVKFRISLEKGKFVAHPHGSQKVGPRQRSRPQRAQPTFVLNALRAIFDSFKQSRQGANSADLDAFGAFLENHYRDRAGDSPPHSSPPFRGGSPNMSFTPPQSKSDFKELKREELDSPNRGGTDYYYSPVRGDSHNHDRKDSNKELKELNIRIKKLNADINKVKKRVRGKLFGKLVVFPFVFLSLPTQRFPIGERELIRLLKLKSNPHPKVIIASVVQLMESMLSEAKQEGVHFLFTEGKLYLEVLDTENVDWIRLDSLRRELEKVKERKINLQFTRNPTVKNAQKLQSQHGEANTIPDVVLETWFKNTSHLIRKQGSTKHRRLEILMKPPQIVRFSPEGDAYSELEYLFSMLDVRMSQKMLQLEISLKPSAKRAPTEAAVVRGPNSGLRGLKNIGNTCFMNSPIQCLVHTSKLVDYFLKDYNAEKNCDNQLGGALSFAFKDLLRELWAPGANPVAPETFKSILAKFAPQFSGSNQHDAQELLTMLLDGLHQDLNRAKHKPRVEAKDRDGRPDEEVADEYWQNHLAGNDSIVFDLCLGQHRSTLICPFCEKVSPTFDAFMYLSLPLPSTTMQLMTLMVMSNDGNAPPSPLTVTVPGHGKFEDLNQALSTACSLRVDETLLVAEIYDNRIIRYLGEPGDSLPLCRDDDQLVAYRLPKDAENVLTVVFMHQHAEEPFVCEKLTSSWKAFGIPLVAKSKISTGSDICNLYQQLLKAFLKPSEDSVDDDSNIGRTAPEELARVEDYADLEFYITDKEGTTRESRIVMEEAVSSGPGKLIVLVCWPAEMFKRDKKRLRSSFFKPDFLARRPRESVSLYDCFETYLMAEFLGPDNLWKCPACKNHCAARKKLDLWRLPEVLVIHLKRFSSTNNKLETYVDFPFHLDLSTYVANRSGQSCNRYMLYAVSNHKGSMGEGHYTAFVHHGGDRWYDFDDSNVSPISKDKIKTPAAYCLFYKRVAEQ